MGVAQAVVFGGPIVASAGAICAVVLDRFRHRIATGLSLAAGVSPWLVFWLAAASHSFWLWSIGFIIALASGWALALAACAYLAGNEDRRRYLPAGACLLGLLGEGWWALLVLWAALHVGE